MIPVHKGQDLNPGTLRGIIGDMGISVDEFAEVLWFLSFATEINRDVTLIPAHRSQFLHPPPSPLILSDGLTQPLF